MAEVGLAPREIRLVILTVGLILAGLAGGVGSRQSRRRVRSGWPPASGLHSVIASATITVIQRILHVRNQAATSGEK